MDILLVEDNPADARLLQEAMAECGIGVRLHWVRSGESALQTLRGANPDAPAFAADLVLLDLNLPGLNGLEVLAEIKQDPALLSVPVVVLTSSAARRDVRQAYAGHANAYITKPDGFEAYLGLAAMVKAHWLTLVLLPTQV